MSRFWDWLTGQDRPEPDSIQLSRQRTREAQEAGLERAVREAALKQSEPIQRTENEPRPGERLMPGQVERQRQMHDYPPVEKKRDQVSVTEREATRLEYTMTPQPAPSMGGPGMKFTNSRAKVREAGPNVAKKLLDVGKAHRGKEGPQPEKQPEIRRGRPLFPDRSQGIELRPPGGKRPGEDDQQ